MILHRVATAADLPFIQSGFQRSYRKSFNAGPIDAASWPAIAHAQVVRWIERPGTRAIVAYDQEHENVRAGFILVDLTTYERPYVYYLYVPLAFRESKVASGLFRAAGVHPMSGFDFQCCTPASRLLRAKIPNARFDPNLGKRDPKEPDAPDE